MISFSEIKKEAENIKPWLVEGKRQTKCCLDSEQPKKPRLEEAQVVA
jgi:hypothetical protein